MDYWVTEKGKAMSLANSRERGRRKYITRLCLLTERTQRRTKMAVMGPVIGTILAIALIFILGPTAGIVLLSIMFGMILSIFMRQKEIYNDLGLIKERLEQEHK
ncbi:hypothetical protein [Paenibacillus stellifer]|nr:hypothetical protein [Paenibacillus stellifer]